MIDFKTYTMLQENCNFLEMSVKIKQDQDQEKVEFDYNVKTKGELSTTFGKGKFVPYISKSKQLMGYPVYSVYKYKGNLKALKALKKTKCY